MSNYQFSFGFLVTDEHNRPIRLGRLERLVDELMHAMLERETDLVFDSSVGAVLDRGEVDIEIDVEAPNERAAKATAADFVLESIRATGGTPMGLFVFPPKKPRKTPRQEWHERRAQLSDA